MAFLYTDIATPQRDGLNFPGASNAAGTGGLTTQPGGFNDPVFELGSASEITAVYTMTGSEAQNDIIYIARVGQGVLVDPVRSSVAGNGAGTTCSVTVGDTDTVGGTVAPDLSRYSAAIDVKADMTATTGVSFAGGTTLITPASITDDNSPPNGNQVWIVAKMTILTVPVAGKKLIFRIKLADNR
jgi:hypothetical protein